MYVEGAAGTGGDCCGYCVDDGFGALIPAAASVPVGVGVDDVLFAGGGGWTNSIAILWLAMVVFPWVGCGVVGSPAACVATVGKGAAGEAVGG